jgi:penicillin-binding protein 2
MFGLGSMTGIDVLTESEGVIPNPAWKAKKYNGDAWRIGDMYLASIGQHEYQITPVQLVRATVAIANKGTLLTPTLFLDKSVGRGKSIIPIPEKYFDIVQEGMQYAVMHGTASGLYMSRLASALTTASGR